MENAFQPIYSSFLLTFFYIRRNPVDTQLGIHFHLLDSSQEVDAQGRSVCVGWALTLFDWHAAIGLCHFIAWPGAWRLREKAISRKLNLLAFVHFWAERHEPEGFVRLEGFKLDVATRIPQSPPCETRNKCRPTFVMLHVHLESNNSAYQNHNRFEQLR